MPPPARTAQKPPLTIDSPSLANSAAAGQILAVPLYTWLAAAALVVVLVLWAVGRHWAEPTRAIFEVEPDYTATREQTLGFFSENARQRIVAQLEHSTRIGQFLAFDEQITATELYRGRLDEGEPYDAVILDLTAPGAWAGRDDQPPSETGPGSPRHGLQRRFERSGRGQLSRLRIPGGGVQALQHGHHSQCRAGRARRRRVFAGLSRTKAPADGARANQAGQVFSR